jgi:hypothetical protein
MARPAFPDKVDFELNRVGKALAGFDEHPS